MDLGDHSQHHASLSSFDGRRSIREEEEAGRTRRVNIIRWLWQYWRIIGRRRIWSQEEDEETDDAGGQQEKEEYAAEDEGEEEVSNEAEEEGWWREKGKGLPSSPYSSLLFPPLFLERHSPSLEEGRGDHPLLSAKETWGGHPLHPSRQGRGASTLLSREAMGSPCSLFLSPSLPSRGGPSLASPRGKDGHPIHVSNR